MTDYFSVQLTDDEIRGISSIGLAHMGDGVYELLVRTWLCAHGKATARGCTGPQWAWCVRRSRPAGRRGYCLR